MLVQKGKLELLQGDRNEFSFSLNLAGIFRQAFYSSLVPDFNTSGKESRLEVRAKWN